MLRNMVVVESYRSSWESWPAGQRILFGCYVIEWSGIWRYIVINTGYIILCKTYNVNTCKYMYGKIYYNDVDIYHIYPVEQKQLVGIRKNSSLFLLLCSAYSWYNISYLDHEWQFPCPKQQRPNGESGFSPSSVANRCHPHVYWYRCLRWLSANHLIDWYHLLNDHS